MAEVYDTIIIGSGVAGLGAAIYTGRFELNTLVIGEIEGGTIINTNEIANYPGFETISGMDLIDKLKRHALQYNAKFLSGKVSDIKKEKDNFIVTVKDKKLVTKTIIYATGTEWKNLNVPGEKEFTGKGVHYCALCDGAFYKDKVVGIVGGSDSAAKEALLLAEYAKKVYIIYRKEDIHAEPITISNVNSNDKIEIIKNTNVTEIKGDKFVTEVILDKEHEGSKEFKLDGLFIDIGHTPISKLAKALGGDINEKGEVVVDRHGNTNISGFFAAGDVTNTIFKQAITGVAEGVTAAYNVYNYLDYKKNIIERSHQE